MREERRRDDRNFRDRDDRDGGDYRDNRDNFREGGRDRRPSNSYNKKKFCRLCMDKVEFIDYKETRMLFPFTSERGKITGKRISGLCAKHQRDITTAIKRARIMALLPFTATQVPLK
ncbi:MAG: 30S ribosomal protein S18 [Pseudomonadota bacterium]